MKIAVLGIPGKSSSERLAAALERRTGFRLLIGFEEIAFSPSGSAVARGIDLLTLDGLVIKKIGAAYSHHVIDRLEVLKHLGLLGLRIFSDPKAIGRAVDRLAGTLHLSRGGIPLPPTVITESVDAAREAVRGFGTAVLKPMFTSKARGMVLVADGPDALASLVEFRADNPVMYIQQKVEIPGRDLGVVFLGGEYLGTYARVGNGGSWNTTTRSGGRYDRHDPSAEVIELAARAQAIFGLDFTCVDVAETPAGPVVFEVSAFGGFRGLFEACGIDAADLFAAYAIERITA